MKILRADRLGEPADVLRCVEVSDPEPPGPGEILIDMVAMPINPADLLQLQGRYGTRPEPLPFVPGAEGLGRVAALGPDVTEVTIGDLVVPLAASTFVERMRTKAKAVIPIPSGIDPLQAAMLKANPATADVMLTGLLPLGPGDWLVQNAANSAVGLLMIRFARAMGVKSINIVRRPEAARAVEEAGGDLVVVSDVDGRVSPEALAAAGPIRIGFDAIGGRATDSLASCLAEGGRIVNYGLLSGEPCAVDPRHLVFRDVTLSGFWLARWFRTAQRHEIQELYGRLVERLAHGEFHTPVAATYPLSAVTEAVAHAARGGRDGKILFTP